MATCAGLLPSELSELRLGLLVQTNFGGLGAEPLGCGLDDLVPILVSFKHMLWVKQCFGAERQNGFSMGLIHLLALLWWSCMVVVWARRIRD